MEPYLTCGCNWTASCGCGIKAFVFAAWQSICRVESLQQVLKSGYANTVLLWAQAGVAGGKKVWHSAKRIRTVEPDPLAASDTLATTPEIRTVELLLYNKLQTCQKGAECQGWQQQENVGHPVSLLRNWNCQVSVWRYVIQKIIIKRIVNLTDDVWAQQQRMHHGYNTLAVQPPFGSVLPLVRGISPCLLDLYRCR